MTQSEFVVTEHKAKRAGLHWDLRFKMPKSNMWASFAVRKGVPLKPGTKVLAVRTHDHKRDEALLTGKIESGYGAGTFKEWDRGKCKIHKYSPAHMAIEFQGKKVKGLYHLVDVGVVDKEFKGKQYFLFKGKSVNEGGMISRIPSGGEGEDVEQGYAYQTGKRLPWSKAKKSILSEEVKTMKDYALIARFKAIKGFFKKSVAGEYLVVAIKDSKNDTFIVFQFFGHIKNDMYVVGIVGSMESPDDEVLEEGLDGLRYHAQVDILEDKVPISVDFKNKITVKFKKPSKYIGRSMVLSQDSRLEQGYFIAQVKVKKGFEPAQQYKLGAGASSSDNNTIKKMRAFTSSRLGALMKRRR